MLTNWLSEDFVYLVCPRRKLKDSLSTALSQQLLAAATYGGEDAIYTHEFWVLYVKKRRTNISHKICQCNPVCSLTICVPECIVYYVDMNKWLKCVCVSGSTSGAERPRYALPAPRCFLKTSHSLQTNFKNHSPLAQTLRHILPRSSIRSLMKSLAQWLFSCFF